MRNQDNIKNNINIINFINEDSFFFQVTRPKSILPNSMDGIDLEINDEDLNIIKNEISKISSTIEKEKKIVKIEVIPFFLDKLNNLQEIERNKSIYSERIQKIIKEYTGQKRLTLKMISLLYLKNFLEPISQMTVSRVLRFNLDLHYRKTIFKNTKLSEKNYILMGLLFLKGIIRSIKLDFNIVYIDETGFCLNNTNGEK